MGDVLTAFPLSANLFQRTFEFLQVFSLFKFLFLQQILYPSRFFNHNGNRVIDLMGDPGRQLAYGCQFSGFDDLSIHHLLGLVRFCDSVNRFVKKD